MLQSILNETQAQLLDKERQALSALQTLLLQFGVTPENRAALERSIHQLDDLFLLVVAGEFNAGKSAVINALLGHTILEEGVTPTTVRIQRLSYGPEIGRTTREVAIDDLTAPMELLRQISIVDTPGTNAINREHEAITEEFVPRSDMVLFITSADRPFTESERRFLQQIRSWGKKVVLVINKIDILETLDEVARVEAFVIENAQRLLDFRPPVFPVSARRALRAKLNQDTTQGAAQSATLLASSRFEALERYIYETLDQTERIRLKLHNPVGVGLRLIAETTDAVEARQALLTEDVATLENLERQTKLYREDAKRDFHYRLAEIDNVLHAFENRGVAFFDETLRLGRVLDLLNREKIEAEFAHNVVGNVPRLIAQQVNDMIDWLVANNLRQWQAVMEHLSTRRAVHAEHLVGQVNSTFEYDRDRLLETVGRAAKHAIETYDRSAEAEQMSGALQLAVAETALIEIGAVGLGAILTALFTTSALDFTGVIAAGTVAALGLFVIPAHRRKAKEDLRKKIAQLRQRLMGTLTEQFEHELENGLHNIETAISPYTRFVRAETSHLDEIQSSLQELHNTFAHLDSEIERV
ncbi:MAG: dynamin family protein [Anaerolineae bacterium]|nr:dynamin family protein [Anaerolineae bacterium]